MAERFNLFQRETHKYNLGWAGEDQWGYLATAKIMEGRKVQPKHDEEGPTYFNIVSVPASAERKYGRAAIIKSIESTMTYSYCRHEHDCCGCPSYYADAKRIKSGTYSVRTRVSYNI